MEPTDPLPAQRAADADREAAAATLRGAGADGRLTLEEMEQRLSAVFAARTHPELDALLADLRGLPGQLGGDARGRWAEQRGSRPRAPEVRRTLTIMSETRRRGFWRPASRSRVITVMGETTIDLRQADLSRPWTELRVITLLGSATIEVPEHVAVAVSKLTLLSDNEVQTAAHPPQPGAPQLHIRLVSILASARVRLGTDRARHAELYA